MKEYLTNKTVEQTTGLTSLKFDPHKVLEAFKNRDYDEIWVFLQKIAVICINKNFKDREFTIDSPSKVNPKYSGDLDQLDVLQNLIIALWEYYTNEKKIDARVIDKFPSHIVMRKNFPFKFTAHFTRKGTNSIIDIVRKNNAIIDKKERLEALEIWFEEIASNVAFDDEVIEKLLEDSVDIDLTDFKKVISEERPEVAC